MLRSLAAATAALVEAEGKERALVATVLCSPDWLGLLDSEAMP